MALFAGGERAYERAIGMYYNIKLTSYLGTYHPFVFRRYILLKVTCVEFTFSG